MVALGWENRLIVHQLDCEGEFFVVAITAMHVETVLPK